VAEYNVVNVSLSDVFFIFLWWLNIVEIPTCLVIFYYPEGGCRILNKTLLFESINETCNMSKTLILYWCSVKWNAVKSTSWYVAHPLPVVVRVLWDATDQWAVFLRELLDQISGYQLHKISWRFNSIKLHGLGPRANYTDRATAAFRRG
jgi:hypothetical protein